jgi:hypothetical protein
MIGEGHGKSGHRASGISTFHPRFINWSYRNRGTVQRTHMKKKMKKMILANKKPTPNNVATFPPIVSATQSIPG